MLKALELAGFKSFADKTRFEFPPGITVIVGPNGSGKSNIVDAIKWVLGEQSVKSLRGKEMADVIFNGSPSRRAVNSAEITLTFSNATHLFAIDAPEVHITRRVYRSGEGEYLINRNPCRLRDIRDLLVGTGLGTQAYSVIEQGKVDVLLQASPKDRRMIFEEAAGISRFKLKKIEALRRLERVEQNLLRLSDIVDEVDSRLRSVRAQAGKARRYQEYTNRLQELRTQVGLVDWQRLSGRLAESEGQTTALGSERDAAAAAAESLDARLLDLDAKVAEIHEAIRRGEAQIAANRERIAAQESTIEAERTRSRDLEQEIARHRRQVVALAARADDLQQQLHETGSTAAAAEQEHRGIAQRLAEGERGLTEVIGRLDHLRGENEQHRAAQLDEMRAAAALGNEISAVASQAAATQSAQEQTRGRIRDLDRQLAALAGELAVLRRQRDELAATLSEQAEALAAAGRQLAESKERLAAQHHDLAALGQRHSGVAERVAVLEELERRQEGLTAGVKEVLAQAAGPDSGPLGTVCGLVADLLTASVEVAPLVEVALGAAAQHVVAVPTPELLDYLRDHAQRLSGRVGFVWLDNAVEAAAWGSDLEGQPGVLGRADQFVETAPRFAPLATRLLGRTWFVEKLAHAMQLAESLGDPHADGSGPSCPNFVTLAGEFRAADGTLVVGPREAAAGLISRRSQLRALRTQRDELEARIRQEQVGIEGLAALIARQQEELDGRGSGHRQAAEALAEHRLRLTAAEERRLQFDQQRGQLQDQLQSAGQEHDQAVALLAEAHQKRQEIEARLAEMESRLAGLAQEIARLEAQRQARNRETTETKVDLAKSEERLQNLHARLRQLEESRQERARAIAEAREQLTQCLQRADASRQAILCAEATVADLYLRKESFAAETLREVNRREALQSERAELGGEVQHLRAKLRKLEERIHAQDLAANEVRHQREDLAARLREDYGIELARLAHTPTGEEGQQSGQVQQEIDQLRGKIASIGNVNLEALEELQSLETRHKTLSDQYQDLTSAKAALEKIIEKINADSRRLFAETLQTVREHFQKLFCDLFGGGQGNIVLEEGVDILESGIEIVARPPGKEPRSISLLSGGEKTLTCVALLLAMFRSRPSPFCVLDEVDAALDEANIDRFTKVLRDFLTWTQFLIVTHSKNTMTCANTLYGVTMQESGVSKQVSVRFEDVTEDGQILPERLAEAERETMAQKDAESGKEVEAA
ncbi:MAG: chromosome segregation protein SMC [Thermoguttaceae bacterium]|jgi:chromosome segregation protein